MKSSFSIPLFFSVLSCCKKSALWFQHLVEQAEQGAGLQTDAILETISRCHDGHQVGTLCHEGHQVPSVMWPSGTLCHDGHQVGTLCHKALRYPLL